MSTYTSLSGKEYPNILPPLPQPRQAASRRAFKPRTNKKKLRTGARRRDVRKSGFKVPALEKTQAI